MIRNWYKKVDGALSKTFYLYGRFIARHPWKIIIGFALTNLLLGIGILRLDMIEDPFYLYTPRGNRAMSDQSKLLSLYPDFSKTNHYTHSLISFGKYAELLVKDKNGGNILTEDGLVEVDKLFQYVLNDIVVTNDNGTEFRYEDYCAKRDGVCLIDGEELLTIRERLYRGEIPYPQFILNFQPMFLPLFLGGVTVEDGRVVEAQSIRFRLNLADEISSIDWELAFKDKVEAFESVKNEIFYSYSEALTSEGNETIERDVFWFAATIAVMVIFATVATMGGNCLSDRSHLGQAGVVATILGVIGAFGLLIGTGVEFVNIVGITPFMIIGIGLDNMFIMMSGLADAIRFPTIEDRIGETMRTSGVAITITSMTDLLAFCVGATSVFPGITTFCIYTAIGILFSYFSYVSFFPACMAIHEQRVAGYRHSCTCQRIRSRAELEHDGASKVYSMCCSGSQPKTRKDVDNPIDKFVGKLTETIFSLEWLRPVIILVYLVYAGIVIWSTIHFKEGLLLEQLSYEGSTFHKHVVTSLELYDMELILSIDILEPLEYSDPTVQAQIESLMLEMKQDLMIRDEFDISWLDAYKSSSLYNETSEMAFVKNLEVFLDSNGFYRNDVIISNETDSILASRLYVRSSGSDDWVAMTYLMVRMREIVDASSLPVTTFSPQFLYYSQIATIVEQTQQNLAFAGISIFIITVLLIPEPKMVLLTLASVASMIVGLIGFMYLWGLTLSSLTMLAMIMSVGFSVDYSVHIIHAYLQAEGSTREIKIKKAIEMAGGPVFNGAFSTFLGILFLLMAKSYVFQTFFIVIFLVLALGSVHALLFIPVALSIIGPLDTTVHGSNSSDEDIISRKASTETPPSNYISPQKGDIVFIPYKQEVRKQFKDSGRFELPRAKLFSASIYEQNWQNQYTNPSFSDNLEDGYQLSYSIS